MDRHDDEYQFSIEVEEQINDDCNMLPLSTLDEVRKRTFTNWVWSKYPDFTSQVIRAGFFYCNTGDRVICIVCDLICATWIPDIDDPFEIHKLISPECAYVRLTFPKRISEQLSMKPVINLSTRVKVPEYNNTLENHTNPCAPIVTATPQHPTYAMIFDRVATFASWNSKNAPTGDDLAWAGFYSTGVESAVTCFYCNGSIDDFEGGEDPITEHVRRFPDCGYARQLCEEVEYKRIRISESRKQIPEVTFTQRQPNDNSRSKTANLFINNKQCISNEYLVSRLVHDRLDLPVSKRIIESGISKEIVKCCWETKLSLHQCDFVSENDLLISCTILQKQIKLINDCQDNIICPSEIIDRARMNALLCDSSIPHLPADAARPIRDDRGNAQNNSKTTTAEQVTASPRQMEDLPVRPISSNNCILCHNQEKQFACLPCGHLTTCKLCLHTLDLCPRCGRNIKSFARIYT